MSLESVIAKNTYKVFSEKEGNQHIAQQYALKTILHQIKMNHVENILEVGLGIGTIPYLVFDAVKKKLIKDITYYGTENNNFCLNALNENLTSNYKRIQLFHSLDEILEDKKFDLIIIDGTDDSLRKIQSMVHENTVIIIEGFRQTQVDIIKELFGSEYVFYDDISLEKNPEYGPFSSDNWQGGVRVFYIYPSFKQKIFFIIKKISTSMKYRIFRKLYNRKKLFH